MKYMPIVQKSDLNKQKHETVCISRHFWFVLNLT